MNLVPGVDVVTEKLYLIQTMEFVIVHYSSTTFEEMVPRLCERGRVVVYDKTGVYETPHCDVRSIPNIGREGATYLKHILDCYDSLADHTVFMQDDVDNHLANLTQFSDVMSYAASRRTNFLQYPCTWNKEGTIYRRRIVNGSVTSIDPPWKDAFGPVCAFLGIHLPSSYVTETCSFFCVSRDRIRIRPKAFYERLYQWVTDSPDHEYILELLWYLIFTRPDEWV